MKATSNAPSHQHQHQHRRDGEKECVAEEAALRAATLRDRAKLNDFVSRGDWALRGLKAVEKAAEEAVFEMDSERMKREGWIRAQGWRRAEKMVVSKIWLEFVEVGRSVEWFGAC